MKKDIMNDRIKRTQTVMMEGRERGKQKSIKVLRGFLLDSGIQNNKLRHQMDCSVIH